MKNKKSLGQVVATSLFLVVVVVSIFGFQTWFQTYSTSTLTNVETQSNIDKTILINGVVGNNLYIYSGSNQVMNELKIEDSNGNRVCGFKNGEKSNFGENTKFLLSLDNKTFNGTDIQDFSKYKINGSINNVIFDENNCVENSCFEFDGTSSNIAFGKKQILNPSVEVTFSAWLYPLNYSTESKIIDKRDNWQSTDGFSFFFLNKNLLFEYGNGTNSVQLSKNVNISLNNWNHLVIILKGNIVTFYNNGNNYGNVFTLNKIVDNNDVNLSIGFSIGRNILYLNGTLDEISIYDKALTDDEVQTLYNERKALLYEQILPNGMKEIDISSCNLQKGQQYQVIAITDSQTLQQTIIVR